MTTEKTYRPHVLVGTCDQGHTVKVGRTCQHPPAKCPLAFCGHVIDYRTK